MLQLKYCSRDIKQQLIKSKCIEIMIIKGVHDILLFWFVFFLLCLLFSYKLVASCSMCLTKPLLVDMSMADCYASSIQLYSEVEQVHYFLNLIRK